MTVAPAQQWATVYVDWMPLGAVLLAMALPILHGILRYVRGHQPAFVFGRVLNDVAVGFTFPSFVALALSGMAPSIIGQIETHSLFLAGALGILHTLREVFKPDRE